MLRRFGQVLAAAVLFAAGCRDMTMDLLPAPPGAAAGAGDESAGGMAGEPPGGDAARGGSGGGRAGGGFGGVSGGGFGACGPGGPETACQPDPCPVGSPGCAPCVSDQSCPDAFDFPFCRYGRCVQCLAWDCSPGSWCGCGTNEICSDISNTCVPRCSTDDDCKATVKETGHPYCDRFSGACIECVSEKDCADHSRSRNCYESIGRCGECFSNEECDEDAPICNLSNLLCQACTDPQCGDSKLCQCGEGKQCNRNGRCDPRPSTPPPPEP